MTRKNVSLKEIYETIENLSDKKIKFSIFGRVFQDLNHIDAKKIKEAFEKMGLEFKEAKTLSDRSYYMEFTNNGIQVDLHYEKEYSLDDEIKNLEAKLSELKARKAEDGEG